MESRVANKFISRRWQRRIGAVGFSFVLICLLEILLRIFGVAQFVDVNDPYVGFNRLRPLFEFDAASNRFVVSKSRQKFFRPASFPAAKSPNEFRIFCFGGSTVQGRPYSTETSFTTWLEISLKSAAPNRNWRVINCGGISYASYRLLPIMRETIQYAPDLFIVYTGHNEFLEDRTYRHVKRMPFWIMGLHERLLRLRIYRIVDMLIGRLRATKSMTDQQITLPQEVEALLDNEGGLEEYHFDPQWKIDVIGHFDANLRRMARLAESNKIPLIFVNPVSNIRDTPPFKSELPDSMSPETRERFLQAWEAAKAVDWNQIDSKEMALKRCLQIEDRFADVHFLLAKCLDAQHRLEEARGEYLLAKDQDVCPLRMLESMHAVLKTVAEQTGYPIVDARAAFEQATEGGLVGDRQLIDHVHPKIEGHQMIADLLFREMAQQNVVFPQKDWRAIRDARYEKHLASLPASYYAHGEQRLRGLQDWARGRLKRLDKPSP